jgi:ABC-2 type transport system ATP-binding protein
LSLRVEACPELVGRIAHHAGVPLIELREAAGTGLEDMFLELTAHTQRDLPPSSHAVADGVGHHEGVVA